jgi:hypothetical protein
LFDPALIGRGECQAQRQMAGLRMPPKWVDKALRQRAASGQQRSGRYCAESSLCPNAQTKPDRTRPERRSEIRLLNEPEKTLENHRKIANLLFAQ